MFFDNLQVTHVRGPLLEETHYYPFGLKMAALSARASGKPSNRYKFNDASELNEDFEIDLYETPFRNYDAQTGRFCSIDLLADMQPELSPYLFSLNNPISYNDPTGLQQQYQGDGGDYSAFWDETIGTLWNTDFGGRWQPNRRGGGITTIFNNEAEAFKQGAHQIQKGGWWGQSIVAGSYAAARSAYYNLGGTDKIPEALDPNLYVTMQEVAVKASIYNGQVSIDSKDLDWLGKYFASLVDNIAKDLRIEDKLGFGESLIPVWGSGKEAYLNFSEGRIASGLWHSFLAVTDVFLVKSAVTMVGKLVVKGAPKALKAIGSLMSKEEMSRVWGGLAKGIVKGGERNFKIISKDVLKEAGIDAHSLKMDFLGKKAQIAQWDLYKETITNEILILKKGGVGEPVRTGIFLE